MNRQLIEKFMINLRVGKTRLEAHMVPFYVLAQEYLSTIHYMEKLEYDMKSGNPDEDELEKARADYKELKKRCKYILKAMKQHVPTEFMLEGEEENE